jgi:serine 3-dehydrogenase
MNSSSSTYPSLEGKLALVTGASSGFGWAISQRLAELGARVLIAARREDRLVQLRDQLVAQYGARACASLQVDVRDREDVRAAFAQLESAGWSEIEILVNNAGLAAGLEPIQAGVFENWDRMIETNLTGLLNVTRYVLPGMAARRRGTIVNIGSVAGRDAYPGGNVYSATKAAVAMLTRGMRIDLMQTGVRVSNVAPGLAETEFSLVRLGGDAEKAKLPYQGIDALSADDVADAVIWIVTRPAHVNVDEIVLMPQAQGSANHISRHQRE